MKKIFTCTIFLTAIIHCCAQISEGYTDKLSYRYTTAGTNVIFHTNHASTTNGPTDFELKDLAGNSLSPQIIIAGFNRIVQNTPPSNGYMVGYGYQSTKTWTVPDLTNLPSGYYLLDNNDPNHPNNKIPIIIKGDNSNGPNGADIVIVCPTNTVNAYTYSDGNHGGHSLYSEVSPPYTKVSFQRPQLAAQFLYCTSFLDWIRTWAANQSPQIKLNFISDSDLGDINNGWDEIKKAKLLIIPGHSEYWTRQARVNFDRFVDNGMSEVGYNRHALILSGNTMWWQVRIEDDTDQTNHPGNVHLICHRGANWCGTTSNNIPYCFDDDTDPNPLLGTYSWMESDLKYSVMGSIGSDWLRCVYVRNTGNSFSYPGHKIILTSSPLLNCTTCTPNFPNFCANCMSDISNNNYIIPINTTNVEYDGTLVKTDANGYAILDGNGNPQLDLGALGFYRGEIIGYNSALQPNTQFDPYNSSISPTITDYSPFMVFQKTSTSGIIINVNSNNWCYDDVNYYGWTGTTPLKADITANMITILMNNINPFSPSTTPPTSITVTPSYSNVSYSACVNGSITYTPNGIYLDKAYKIDNGFTRNEYHTSPSAVLIDRDPNTAIATIDVNCSGTPFQPRIGYAVNEKNKESINEQTVGLTFSLYPNPTINKFTLQVQTDNSSNRDVFIHNSIGEEILHLEHLTASSTVIDLSSNPKGIYFIKLIQEGKETVKKIVYL